MARLTLGIAIWMAGLRSALQYRTDTFIIIVMALVFQGTGLPSPGSCCRASESRAGWTLGQVAFLRLATDRPRRRRRPDGPLLRP